MTEENQPAPAAPLPQDRPETTVPPEPAPQAADAPPPAAEVPVAPPAPPPAEQPPSAQAPTVQSPSAPVEPAPAPVAEAPAQPPAPQPPVQAAPPAAPSGEAGPAAQDAAGAVAEAQAAPPEAPPAPAEAVQAPAPAEKPPEPERRPTVIVRYGAMGVLGRFVDTMETWRCGQRVIIKSDRGMEIGIVLCKWDGCGAPPGISPQIKGEAVRVVTHVDEIEERHLQESAAREFAYGKKCIAERNLPMKLVSVEHLFGGDRIVFYFVSESRVDFRALVRDLAHEFQTRIEMRQIGVRDEARILGDYERCGRPLCCRAWIKELEPVSMKMAKVQKATLDPTKISGRCGRLMCCLRFEHATYRDLARNLPRKGTPVGTPQGRGTVIDTDVVTQMVGVMLDGGTRVNVPVEGLLAPDAAPPAKVDRRRDDGRQPAPRTGQADAAVETEAPPEPRDGSEPKARPEAPPRPPAPLPETPPDQAAPGAAPGAPPGAPQAPGEKRGRRRRGRRRSRRGGRDRNRPPNGPGGTPPAAPGRPNASTPNPPQGE